jgi:fructokinase
MPNIYAIGETIYDIIFRNNEPVAAKAGGSMLNTAVSLGRLGLPVWFISEYSVDQAGMIIDDFLKNNGVDSSRSYRYSEGKTPIALAFLNEKNDARYSFYKPYPEKRLEIELPNFKPDDIILFGAFYSLMEEVREQLVSFVKAARKAGALIIYDPNIRSPHKDEIESLRTLIHENFQLADIVRGSDEDFRTMFDVDSGEEAFNIVNTNGSGILIYTKNSLRVEAYYAGNKIEMTVPEINTLSTIGAGDSFNAGLIFELIRLGITREKMNQVIDDNIISKIISTAISFGSHVCTHYENYISEEFAGKLS